MTESDKTASRSQDILPEPTLRRLPWYLAYLSTLRSQKVEYISSTRIADDLKVAPSQIAKDLSFLGLRGKTRIGYSVTELEESLRNFLGFGRRHNAVMVGAGSLGAALIADSGLQRYGLNIVASVDINPNLIGTSICGVPVYHTDNLPELASKLNIAIGIVAVPVESAAQVAQAIVDAGIKAIWNFTPTRIAVPEGVVVTNTSIYSHLAVMYNRLSNLENK